MKQGDYIQGKYFLEALRTGGTFSADYESLYGQPDTLPGKDRRRVYERELAHMISSQSATIEPITGADRVSDLLQQYADEWLATGCLDPDGRERPLARKLTETKKAWEAVRWFENVHHLNTIDWDNGLERRPKTLTARLRLNPPRGNTKDRDPKDSRPHDGSEKSIMARVFEHRRLTSKDLKPIIEGAVKMRAAGIFHAFMGAPWRYQLGKCKRCYSYFVLKHKPTKVPYIRGMHCPGCKSAASAEASLKAKREGRQSELVGLAADALSAWHPTPGEPKEEWIAKEVRAKLGLKLGQKGAIQRSWVTRHLKQIDTEIKGRARAKS